MKLLYISPSLLPSKAANSVHVVNQCIGIREAGAEVCLIAKRAVKDESRFHEQFEHHYGYTLADPGFRVLTLFNGMHRAVNIWITLFALWKCCLGKVCGGGEKYDLIISRNLYAAYLLAMLLRKPLIYETHQIEKGFRSILQKQLLQSDHVKTVVISEKLKKLLEIHLKINLSKVAVLHDAAPGGIRPVVQRNQRLDTLGEHIDDVAKWEAVCGYFGHLYSGRGLEVIEQMASQRADVLFVIYGGTSRDVEQKRRENTLGNLCFMGHVSHPAVKKLMVCFDVLLMPYQQSVSIGIAGHDTAQWMSPMKMFEYLASGVPIISSDLPVLREVLQDGKNCLLAKFNGADDWLGALDRILGSSELANSLGQNAHKDYIEKYTWKIRAEKLLDLGARLETAKLILI